MNRQEEWRDVKGYEGLYAVSNHGRVVSLERLVNAKYGKRTVPKKILRFGHNGHGYLAVSLSKECSFVSTPVHKIVAEAFIGMRPSKDHQINHIDGDKTNNHADNLEWVTGAENIRHSVRLRTFSKSKGVSVVDRNTNDLIKSCVSITEASEFTGVSVFRVVKICNGKSHSLVGLKNFNFKFEN